MDNEYSNYLNSDAWKIKRLQRLKMANFKCAACASSKSVQVHHLTYERIYNELMTDLLPLCDDHHRFAEALIANKVIPRHGDTLFLATETVRLVVGIGKSLPEQRPAVLNHHETRNDVQDFLMECPAFMTALKTLKRSEFKRFVKKFFKGDKNRNKITANAFALYDHHLKSMTVSRFYGQ